MIFSKKVMLPREVEEFDALVKKVVKRFKLKDEHHAAAIISVAIRHLPNDQAHTTIDYLGYSVLKNLANYIANHKGQLLQHEAQISALEDKVRNYPNDQQARDELTKAANEGSEAAKTAIERLYPADPLPLNVTPIQA